MATTCSWRRCCWPPHSRPAWQPAPFQPWKPCCAACSTPWPPAWTAPASHPGSAMAMDARGPAGRRAGDGCDGRRCWMPAARCSGAAPWWPPGAGAVLGAIAARVAGPQPATRLVPRPSHFPDAGVTILRSGDIWLRCDAGPHGHGSIAAHGHADALSIELRCAGVEVLADPGTYCYHGEPAWRSYFRGTRGHSTAYRWRRGSGGVGRPPSCGSPIPARVWRIGCQTARGRRGTMATARPSTTGA